MMVCSAVTVTGEATRSAVGAEATALQQRPVNQELPDNVGAARWIGVSINRPVLFYELVLNGDRLTGRLGSRDVQLKKTDGVWSGRFGEWLVPEALVTNVNENTAAVRVSFAGGSGRRRIETRENGEVELSGGPNRLTLSADGKILDYGPGLELATQDGRLYTQRRLLPGRSVPSQLEVVGALAPSLLARSDPVLYALLYAFGPTIGRGLDPTTGERPGSIFVR